MMYLSPDCRSANHRKCGERAWDVELDRLTLCMCDCHDFYEPVCEACEGDGTVRFYDGRTPQTRPCDCVIDGGAA